MQTLKLIVLFGWLMVFSCAQKPVATRSNMNWMTLDEVASQMEKEKRPVLISLYTDWCGWCKVMDKKTYSNKNVIEYIQQKFYPSKINAETRQEINYNGRSFGFNTNIKTNDFAIYLTQGQLSYPTTIIIPTDGSGPQAIPGFLSPAELELILKYFGENHYGKVPFDEFQKSFKSSW